MAAVNSIISQADYTSIRNKIVAVLGAGGTDPATGTANPTYGYGIDSKIKSTAITEGNTVTINEWSNLRYDLINAYLHIYGSIPTTYQVVEGDTVRYNATNAPVDAHNTLANTIVTNRMTIAAGQFSTSGSVSNSRTFTWSTSASVSVTATFTSANEARWFFNSGGTVKITSSFVRTTGVNTLQNQNWETLLSTAGAVSFGATTPGTGTSPSDGQNWYRLTSTPQRYYQASGTSPYGANRYNLYANSDVANNSTGTGIAATFTVEYVDAYQDPDDIRGVPAGRRTAPTDVVDGTLTVSVALTYPNTTLVPSGWGTFTVVNPTINIGSFTGS